MGPRSIKRIPGRKPLSVMQLRMGIWISCTFYWKKVPMQISDAGRILHSCAAPPLFIKLNKARNKARNKDKNEVEYAYEHNGGMETH